MTIIDILDGGPPPKRGDLVHTNVGDRRERTWLILRVRAVKRHANRYELWMARWWELEPDFRMRLAASAERRGGQRLIHYKRYSVTRKKRGMDEYLSSTPAKYFLASNIYWT